MELQSSAASLQATASHPQTPPSPRQLDLVLHDARLKDLTTAQRQAARIALAHLLIEASGVAIGEASNDHA